MKSGGIFEGEEGGGGEEFHPKVQEVFNLLDDDEHYLNDMQQVLGSLCPTPTPGSPSAADFFKSMLASGFCAESQSDKYQKACSEMSPIADLLKDGIPEIATLSEDENDKQKHRLFSPEMGGSLQRASESAALPPISLPFHENFYSEGTSALSGSGEIMALWGESLQDILGNEDTPSYREELEKELPLVEPEPFDLTSLNWEDPLPASSNEALPPEIEALLDKALENSVPCPGNNGEDTPATGGLELPGLIQHSESLEPYPNSCDMQTNGIGGMYPIDYSQQNYQGSQYTGISSAQTCINQQYCNPQIPNMPPIAEDLLGYSQDYSQVNGLINNLPCSSWQNYVHQPPQMHNVINPHNYAQENPVAGTIPEMPVPGYPQYGQDNPINPHPTYQGNVHQGIPAQPGYSSIIGNLQNQSQWPQPNMVGQPHYGLPEPPVIQGATPRRKRGRASNKDKGPQKKKNARPGPENTVSDATPPVRVLQGVVIDPKTGQKLKLGPAANMKMREAEVPMVSRLFADICSENPTLRWMTRNPNNMVARDMHGATPQAHHKARNEEPCIYPPYSVPEANGNEPGDQVQEVYPGFVATANRFIETDLLNCVDPKEMEGSWERQMGGGANQQATPNLCLQGVTQMGMCSGPKFGGILGGVLREASAACLRNSTKGKADGYHAA